MLTTKAPRHQDIIQVLSMEELDKIGKEIVDIAFQIHKSIGPGLLEGIYQECFVHLLKKRNISFEEQRVLSIPFDDIILKSQYRLDLIVGNSIVIELKCVERLISLHEAQLLSYLKLANCRLGYLINFNAPLMKDGIKRMIL